MAMSTTFEKIQEALFAALKTALNTTPIAWPNVRFEPTADQAFVEVYLDHKPARRLTIGENPWMEYRGILRLHIAVPVHGGANPAAVIQDAIGTAFYSGAVVNASPVSVRIEASYPDRGFQQKTWSIFPLEVRWVCEVQG
jgi:hypothetical protein